MFDAFDVNVCVCDVYVCVEKHTRQFSHTHTHGGRVRV